MLGIGLYVDTSVEGFMHLKMWSLPQRSSASYFTKGLRSRGRQKVAEDLQIVCKSLVKVCDFQYCNSKMIFSPTLSWDSEWEKAEGRQYQTFALKD